MTVARVASAENIRTGTTDPHTFSYAGGTPEGIAIAIMHGISGTALASSVSYGGVPLALVVEATDTATEPGNAQIWFLGSGVPTGTQTVSIDLTSASTTDIHTVVWELSGADDLEVIDSDEINDNAANPTVTLQAGGRSKIGLCAMYGGGAAPGGTLAAGNTLDHTHDHGAFYSQTCYETTVDNADHTIGWSTLGTDDLAFVAVAISEVPQAVTGTATPTETDQTSAASGSVAAPVTGTSTQTQDAQTSAASAVETISGTSAQTQAAQTSTASGLETVTGTVGQTQGNQASTAAGDVVNIITGTLAGTQSDQTSTASGILLAVGVGSATQANQTPSAAGIILALGIGSGTQADQLSTADGLVLTAVTGTVAVTQADQFSTAEGGLQTVTGTLTVTAASQTSAAVAVLLIVGSGVVTQTDDIGIAAGTATSAFIGSAAVVQQNQTAAAVGSTPWSGGLRNPVALTRNPAAFVRVGADDPPPW